MKTYAPEVLERARQLVQQYGIFSVTNENTAILKDIWEREHPELIDNQGRDSFRALVLAGRDLHTNGGR